LLYSAQGVSIIK